jgi:hypothetical protein
MNFIFVIHNHQPVGNFDYVIEEAYKKSYKPFIDSIIDTKEFRFGIHFSGYLLQYIEKNHPELIEKLRYLVGQRRCEIISGGLYEPILILLPEKDRKEQINRMNDYIEKLFRVRPRGFWLAERVWEQELAKTLSANGIRYTFVDDTHFKVSGIPEEKLRKHFITETEGNPLYVFPISKKLRYLIPFKSPEKIFEYLKEQDKDEERMELLGDDGEKFGVWPGTFKYVYEEGWLKNFLDLLKEQSSWLKMTPPMEFVKNNSPEGRVYLKESSYEEMMEWSNGNYRNFLLKYPESNDMNKKCIYLSRKAENIPDELLKSEANDAYWHGVFGGLYLPHLRISIYENAIKAEKKIQKDVFDVKKMDLNNDGIAEIIAETPFVNAYFSKTGGTIYELDDKVKELNLSNVLTRREEPYHKKILEAKNKKQENNTVKTIHEIVTLKENDLDNFLIYDWYRRNSFIDHFFREDTSIERTYKMDFGEQGDFVLEPFKHTISKDEKNLYISFKRDGHVWYGEDWEEITLNKTFTLPKNERAITANYLIKSEREMFLFFGIEMNFMLFKDGMEINGKKYKEFMEIESDEFEIKDFIQQLVLNIKFSEPLKLWTFPIYTVSQSESGFEKTFQGITFIFSKKGIIKEKQISIKLKLN